MSKYCIMPFASIRIEDALNEQSTKIRPCCFYKYDHKPLFNNIREYLDSTELAQLQHHLLTKNELPPGCVACQKVENANQLSVRQLKEKYFNINALTNTAIQELDLFVSNVCNLTCVMCSPKFSSAVGAEYKKLGLVDDVFNFDETDFILENLTVLTNLKYVSIAGGEFFYAKQHKKILRALVDHNIPNIKITTNGTIYNQHTVDVLKEIPNLSLRFSIDGLGDLYEFIRYPAKWHEVEHNILKFKQELPDAHIEMVIVMNSLTIFGVFDWLAFANKNNIETHFINILGPMLSWETLTDEERKIASEFLINNFVKSKLTRKQIVSLLNYAKSTLPNIKFDPDIRKQTLSKLVTLCQSRNIDIKKLTNLTKMLPSLTQDIDKIC